jgi:hypothetical protein
MFFREIIVFIVRITKTHKHNLSEREDFLSVIRCGGARGGVVVKALRYKLAGRGLDSQWCHWNFSLT